MTGPVTAADPRPPVVPPGSAVSSWPDVLSALTGGRDLTEAQVAWAMGEILLGAATPAQIAGFAVALRTKGETVDEVSALSEAMLTAGSALKVPGVLLDIVGTGGDRSMSVNISTMAAIVAAGAGARVVKHGSRSASSQSGSADVLEALGIRLDLRPEQVAAVAEEAGITFAFAAAFHPAMRHAAVPRRELGIATTFNFLGPLSNPARPAASAIGCADPRMAPIMAEVLARRGSSVWVVRGDDGMDELTVSTTSTVWCADAEGSVRRAVIDPEELGIERSPVEALRGGDPGHNAEVVRRLLAGERGAVRDAVLLNAGAALAVHAEAVGSAEDSSAVVTGKASDPASGRPGQTGPDESSSDLVAALRAGIDRAADAIDSGAAARTLDAWIASSTAMPA